MTPGALMTAFAQVSQAVDAIQNGAADYLVKPFEGDVLIGLMDRLTRRCQSEGGVIAEDARTQALVDMAHTFKKVLAMIESLQIFLRLWHQMNLRFK